MNMPVGVTPHPAMGCVIVVSENKTVNDATKLLYTGGKPRNYHEIVLT